MKTLEDKALETIYRKCLTIPTKEEIISKLNAFFEGNAARYDVDTAFLYGSWARGYSKEDSDIDVAVIFSPEPASVDREFDLITDISIRLSQVMKVEVNIISLHPDFQKPMLYYNAIVLGVPVYVKHPHRYVALKLQAIFHMEDFNLFGIGWQLEIARRNLVALKHA